MIEARRGIPWAVLLLLGAPVTSAAEQQSLRLTDALSELAIQQGSPLPLLLPPPPATNKGLPLSLIHI